MSAYDAEIRRMHALNMSDAAIAKVLKISRRQITTIRNRMKLPRVSMTYASPGKWGVNGSEREFVEAKIRELHETHTNKEIGEIFGMRRVRIAQIRREMGLDAKPEPAPRPTQASQFRVSQKPASAPDNGATLRAVRIKIIRQAVERASAPDYVRKTIFAINY